MTSLGTLTLLPTLPCAPAAGGRISLTKKFVEGVGLYCKSWPGPVRAIMQPVEQRTDDLDQIELDPRELPFQIELCRLDSPEFAQKLADSAVVLGGPDYRVPHLVSICKKVGVPAVYNTEYSLRTRLQIARLEERSPLRQLKHTAWELDQERRTLQDLLSVEGVQCNGTPTYNLYRRFARNPLLFFDTRTEHDLFATDGEMTQREQRLGSPEPLTLAFSGRLIPMKGAEHLLDVAALLKQKRFPFRFLIAGDGTSAAGMRERIAREGLDEVQMLGVLPFRTELMPLVRSQVDVFVACHRQGDPSCTYLETLAAGAPIVGYENEAFAGLLQLANVGWGSPLDQPAPLAELIMKLPREQIRERSREALRFAKEHGFETTFERRVAHLIDVARRHQARA